MPGRPKSRPSEREPRVSAKGVAQSSQVSGAEHDSPTQLRTQFCRIFGDAQINLAGHRKLVVSLRKVQESCIRDDDGGKARKSQDLLQFAEEDFNAEFARCVIRLMTVKKGEGIGDKLVRFIGLFLKNASEKDTALLEEEIGDDALDIATETPTSRLANHLFSLLTTFLSAREKTVRFRATQLTSHIINSLDALDEELYSSLRSNLLKRIRDKEASVRVQAVIGLGRLAGNEEDDNGEGDSDDDEAGGLVARLLEILQNDPSAEVRRTLLLNLSLTPSTLPYLLERARDSDASTRKALYSRLLPSLGDFRHLSLSMREKLLRWGLRDRDENVQKATARLFRERWIDDCAGAGEHHEGESEEKSDSTNIDALLELLERIDVINSGIDEGIGGEAMKAFWDGRPDYRQDVILDRTFWKNLTPESAFMARTLNDFYHSAVDEDADLGDGKFPEITELALYLQTYIDRLVDAFRANNNSDNDAEETTVETEFEIEQMLHIAKTLDYSDEIGRRKIFGLMRETLAIGELPEGITQLVVDVLRDVCRGEESAEREFCSVVLEAISDLHDTILGESSTVDNEDESFHSAKSELDKDVIMNAKPSAKANTEEDSQIQDAKAIREIVVNMKCLHIAQCMLQNVEGSLQSNVHLVAMLNNLVVPAVRSQEAPIRERGLLCMGLCCLLDKSLAEEHLYLFLHCFSNGHDALQVTAINTIADILESHPALFRDLQSDDKLRKSIVKMFSKGIKNQQASDVQMAATVALCKLMLVNIIQDQALLKLAVISFFDPASKSNTGMRQALSYSLPVFSFTKKDNMEQMAAIAEGVIHTVIELNDQADDDEELVNITNLGNVLVDWTDARKLVISDDTDNNWSEAGEKNAKVVNTDAHLLLAESLLERAMHHSCSKEERKALMPNLGKLYISPSSTHKRLEGVRDLAAEAIDSKVAGDAPSRTALNKLYISLNKALGQVEKPKTTAAEDTEVSMADVEGETSPAVTNEAEQGSARDETAVPEQDSMMEELLSDHDDTL